MAKKKNKVIQEENNTIEVHETKEETLVGEQHEEKRAPKSYIVVFANPSRYVLKNHNEIIEFNKPNTYFKGDEVIW